jgi:hypothetical protein
MLRSNLEPFAVILLLCFLIGVALLAGPFYALWLRGGRRADRRGQRRRNHRDSMKYGRFNWRPLSFQNLVLEGHTFRIVFREPGLRGVLVGEYLARDAP